MQKYTGDSAKVRSPYRRIIPLLLCILIALASVVCLSACTRYGGSRSILSRSELQASIGEEQRSCDYVCDYIDKWDFPRFNKTKLQNIENKFLEVYIGDLPDIYDHAKDVANYFLDNFYDKIDLENTDKVTDALAKSYVEEVGDKYASYYSASEYASYVQKMSGENEKTVTYTLDQDGIGYIKITAFKANTAEQFKQAINYMEENHARGLVFDVRDNSGGYLDAATKSLEYITPLNKKIVSYKTKNDATVVVRAMDVHSISIPCTVICNGNTASAAELFASAIRDYHKMSVLDAYVVGEKTLGKGVMQDTYTFDDGSALTLTTAHYYPPSDESYDGEGIYPDIASDESTAVLDAYDRVLTRIAMYFSELSKDEFLEFFEGMLAKPQKEHKFITDYLRDWDFPICDINKFAEVQQRYLDRVGPINNVFTQARDTAYYFIRHFYEKTDVSNQAELTDALITAWIKTLGDEYAEYRTEEQFLEFAMTMEGKSIGVGITIDKKTHIITNVSIDSDAYTKNVMEGDILYKINNVEFIYDDKSTEENEDNYDEIARMFSGNENTSVSISIIRGATIVDDRPEGGEIIENITITRKLIDQRTVSYSLEEFPKYDVKVGYVDISSFKKNTLDQFIDAINALEKAGAEAYVFDVRSNTGGTLSSVTDIIDYLAPVNNTIISFKYTNGEYRAPIMTYNKHTIGMKPCVVICNRYTASAGELFTAALRDYTDLGIMNAYIIGEKTFGKGVLQETEPFSDGSAVTLTVAYYYPPLGEEAGYNLVGIIPDEETSSTSEQWNRSFTQAVTMVLTARAEGGE